MVQKNTKRGLGLIAAGCGIFVISMLITMCNRNSKLAEQNEKLRTEAREKSKRMKDAVRTIDYMAGQRDQLIADLDNCRGPKTKPAAKPAQRTVAATPVAKPAPVEPVATPKPVVIRDTIRVTDTVRPVRAATAPANTGSEYSTVGCSSHRTITEINLSADGRCVSLKDGNSSGDVTPAPVVADTVRNTVVADTISKAR